MLPPMYVIVFDKWPRVIRCICTCLTFFWMKYEKARKEILAYHKKKLIKEKQNKKKNFFNNIRVINMIL